MASPATALGYETRLKTPDFQLGDVVVPGSQWQRDFPYFRKQYTRHLIREYRKVAKRIPQYLGTGKIAPGCKEEIRKCVNLFSNATEFEVAGIFVDWCYNLDKSQFNACYLAGVPGAAGPPSFGVQLLIRYREGNNNLALIVGYGVDSNSLRKKS